MHKPGLRYLWMVFFSFGLILLAACQSSTSGLTPRPGETQTPIPGVSFQNPVLRRDFPDPFILRVGDQFYAYATNSGKDRVQVALSSDLVHWEMQPDAMPILRGWTLTSPGFTWAPEVMRVGDRYLLYYTSRDRKSNRQCIGVAVSSQPGGEFKDTRNQALVCQVAEGGSIDPSPFQDGDKRYLYFKNDGNCCGKPTYISVQELAEDGLSLVGQPTRLIGNDQPWEGKVIEAPTMVKHAGKDYLFYSANNYAGAEYAVGYAVCESPTGPCQKAAENPILKSQLDLNPPVIGPGHQSVFQLGDQSWIVYHAWATTPDGKRGNARFMWLDRLDWVKDKPVVRGPTTGVQPDPRIR